VLGRESQNSVANRFSPLRGLLIFYVADPGTYAQALCRRPLRGLLRLL